MVDKNADELLADGPVEERRADGRVNAAGKRKQDLLVADLLLDRLDLFLDVLLRVEDLADAGKALFLCLVHVFSLYALNFRLKIFHSCRQAHLTLP